jgi:hypothetical protein
MGGVKEKAFFVILTKKAKLQGRGMRVSAPEQRGETARGWSREEASANLGRAPAIIASIVENSAIINSRWKNCSPNINSILSIERIRHEHFQ